MAGQNILAMEEASVESQQEASGSFAYSDKYDVYINDYGNYGNWMDCNDYH